MSEREAIQTDEGGGGKNCEPRTHVGTPSPTVHPPEVFPPLPSVSDLLHLDVLSTGEALRALPQSKVVLLRLEHP